MPAVRLRRPPPQAIGRRPAARPQGKFVEAGLIDEIQIHLAPVVLGDGVRLFDHIGKEHFELENQRVVDSPGLRISDTAS